MPIKFEYRDDPLGNMAFEADASKFIDQVERFAGRAAFYKDTMPPDDDTRGGEYAKLLPIDPSDLGGVALTGRFNRDTALL